MTNRQARIFGKNLWAEMLGVPDRISWVVEGRTMARIEGIQSNMGTRRRRLSECIEGRTMKLLGYEDITDETL